MPAIGNDGLAIECPCIHPVHSVLPFVWPLSTVTSGCDVWTTTKPPTRSIRAREKRDTLEEVNEHAREHLRTAQKRQKDHFDQRIAGEQIEVGDRVFLHDPAVKRGQT